MISSSPSHPFLRRRSSVLQKVIQGRRSFRDLSARADKLEIGFGDSSFSEAIASFFLSKQQEAVEARLREEHQLHRLSFRHLIHLLRFTAYCSWRSSLLCGSIFRDIIHAKCCIARVEIILNSPSCRSQVRDLLLALSDLHNLFSEETITRIRHANLLLRDLECDLKSYEEKTRVRALSGLSAMKRRTKHGISRCTMPVRHLAAFVRSKMFMSSDSDAQKGENLGDQEDVDEDVAVSDANSDKARDASGMLSSSIVQCADYNTLRSLHTLHVRLHQIETSMHAVCVTFDTLMPLLSGTHNQSLSQHLIDILRDDPLMFDGVAAQIADCHARLSKHLEDVREQVLICFCYINNARDLAYAI